MAQRGGGISSGQRQQQGRSGSPTTTTLAGYMHQHSSPASLGHSIKDSHTDDDTRSDKQQQAAVDNGCRRRSYRITLPQHPLCQSILQQLGIISGQEQLHQQHELTLTEQQVKTYTGMGFVLGSVVAYQIMISDLGTLFQRMCNIVVPIFSIGCAFFWLAFYLRKQWSITSIYVFICACFGGELLGQAMVSVQQQNGADNEDALVSYIMRPMLLFVVLTTLGVASLFSSLETHHSTQVIGFVSVIRLLACSTLLDLPQTSRPYLAYIAGLAGIFAAKYMETLMRPTTPTSQLLTPGVDAPGSKVSFIKRRRSTAAALHPGSAFANRAAGRRTSLPALIQKPQTPTSGYESAIIAEAHGLITDMLADTSLPPHVVSGLRAVANLLKPPDNHNTGHKPKVSPLVSLTEAASYGSDSEDLPYTGERPSSLPKRLRRSLPPSLIRRMSTSTWTTTTSATGLPTLEPEPCRTRSSSFRHSRDSSPGSSPTGSRSNSPSPSSPTAVSLTIPKSRSFSVAHVLGPSSSNSTSVKRGSMRERRSLQHGAGLGSAAGSSSEALFSPIKSLGEKLSPLNAVNTGSNNNATTIKGGVDSSDGTASSFKDISAGSVADASTLKGGGSGAKGDVLPAGLSKRLNITSDYESNDSPSSSDHSDNVLLPEEGSLLHGGSVLSKEPVEVDHIVLHEPALNHRPSISTDSADLPAADDTTTTSCSNLLPSSSSSAPTPQISLTTSSSSVPSNNSSDTLTDSSSSRDTVHTEVDTTAGREVVAQNNSSDTTTNDHCSTTTVTGVDLELVNTLDLLDIKALNDWDYPVFDLAAVAPSSILSMVVYRLFEETGLFDTFRIPLPEFLYYFHALELGYQNKPYHNRIHATDVLHGVYYLTTQPIPGFTQCNPAGDPFQKASSCEADEAEKCHARNTSFLAEETYGIMGGNFPPLELMAMFAAAAMHDYDHPGRTNAFLVATNAPLAILYNDRSVLECHHAASAWRLFLSQPQFNWLQGLDKGEFKRFRFLVIEAILATDLKRHFELLAEFNAKVNDEDAPGIDWMSETDRLMVANMVIKMADINGPCKRKDLHVRWTESISEEFYEQGDEEASLGLPISPYMDRNNPQLAKLQESFINHLVAPLCNALGAAGLLPGTWVEDDENTSGESDQGTSTGKDDSEDEDSSDSKEDKEEKPIEKKIHCCLTSHIKDNHDMWVSYLKMEAAMKEKEINKNECPKEVIQRALSLSEKDKANASQENMEPIKEEDTPPASANDTPATPKLPAVPQQTTDTSSPAPSSSQQHKNSSSSESSTSNQKQSQ